MANRLTLQRAGSEKFGLVYEEFVVDGRPLRELLQHSDPEDQELDSRGLGPVGENVSVLVHNWPAAGVDGVLVMLGERTPELADGRVLLYVCPACGDVACGAVSAVVELSEHSVVWRDFGWDTGRDDGEDEIRFVGGPFVFDRDEYDADLRHFVDTCDAVRASLPPRGAPPVVRQRSRRWPWVRTPRTADESGSGSHRERTNAPGTDQTKLDLDEIAASLERRRATWVAQGLTVGELTWCDIDARWPWRPTTDRSSIGAPVSLGVVICRGESEARVCVWEGGWADVDAIIGEIVVTEVPWFGDTEGCVAAVEAVAARVANAH